MSSIAWLAWFVVFALSFFSLLGVVALFVIIDGMLDREEIHGWFSK